MTIENPVSVWRLKVKLLGVAPAVWRRFDTYADVKLSQLHYYIQGVMGCQRRQWQPNSRTPLLGVRLTRDLSE